MQEYFLQERGIAYRTNRFAPHKKTVLFVHGLSGSLSAWYPFEKFFEDDYNIVTFDLRGHGLSIHPRSRKAYALHEHIEDIRALLQHLGINRCSIVSHSFGTLLAMEFARAHAPMVERTVYLAPVYGVTRFWLRNALSAAGAALALCSLRIRPYGRTDYTRFYPTSDFSPARIAADIANMGLRSYLLALRMLFERNYDKDWSLAAAPARIVHGERDRFIPIRNSRLLANQLPTSSLIELKGANHILIINNVEEVARLIRDFIAQ